MKVLRLIELLEDMHERYGNESVNIIHPDGSLTDIDGVLYMVVGQHPSGYLGEEETIVLGDKHTLEVYE